MSAPEVDPVPERSSPFSSLAEAARVRSPEVALVLGSGMGAVVDRLQDPCSLPFVEIPGLCATSVAGHGGRLTLGMWHDRRVLLFEGRLHFYEGHPWRAIVQSVRIAAQLGARILVCTNAAGGIRDDLMPGSLMVIRDHIEWNRASCWRSALLGSETVCSSPYCPELRELFEQAGREVGIDLRSGVYAAVTGPSYE